MVIPTLNRNNIPDTSPKQINKNNNNDVTLNNAEASSQIDVLNNKIYFYSGVHKQSALRLNKELIKLNNELINYAYIYNCDPPHIELFISSNGGTLMDGFSIMDTILSLDVDVHTIIDGAAASAASLISIVGTKRYIKEHSYVLIHQLSAGTWGNYEQLSDDMINWDKFMKMLKGVYKEYTKVPMKELEEILKHDLWFDKDEALHYGIVDEIWTYTPTKPIKNRPIKKQKAKSKK